MSDAKKMSFQEWWDSPSVKHAVGAIYSLGAAVVIIGAMFKILHLPFAGIMLGMGMAIEAILFALGIFDKPHTEYKWQNVFPSLVSKEPTSEPLIESAIKSPVVNTPQVVQSAASASVVEVSVPVLPAQEMEKLSTGIKQLSETAQQIGSLASIVDSTSNFANSLTKATETTSKLTVSQEQLLRAADQLGNSYQTISSNTVQVVKETEQYSKQIGSVNQQLSSINSIYELQLRSLQTQATLFESQNSSIERATAQVNAVQTELTKVHQSVFTTANESLKVQNGVTALSGQIADLNKVYGNMLNALS